MRFFLLKAWPALIPLVLYLLWLLWRRRQAKRSGAPLPGLRSGPWLWVLAACFALLVASVFVATLQQEGNAGASYQPKRFEDGRLIDEVLQ